MHPLIQRAGLFVCFAAVAMYAFVTFQGPHGIPALQEKRRQIVALQEENATLAANNRRLAMTVAKLSTDKAAQGSKVRERLKLLQPGETQFILPEQKPQPKSE
jgi:cell division protein FtsB